MAKTTSNSQFLLMQLFFTLLISVDKLTLTAVATNAAYPTTPDCSLSAADDELKPIRREVYGEGRIFDVSHRYTSELPSYDTEDGRLGEFLRLPVSMKKGSIVNISEMKITRHTGTHVDAPGHVFDHYFDAGFDVDTLDLDVLNGNYPFQLISEF